MYDAALVEPLARALGELGAKRVLVVHGSDGLDELTTTGTSEAALAESGRLVRLTVDPEQLGLPRADPSELLGGDTAHNAGILTRILDGEAGPKRDIVALNAAAALWAAGAVAGLDQGLVAAAESLASGAARDKLAALVRATHEVAS